MKLRKQTKLIPMNYATYELQFSLKSTKLLR